MEIRGVCCWVRSGTGEECDGVERWWGHKVYIIKKKGGGQVKRGRSSGDAQASARKRRRVAETKEGEIYVEGRGRGYDGCGRRGRR